MKIIKNILKVFLTFLTIDLVIALIITSSFKETVFRGIIMENMSVNTLNFQNEETPVNNEEVNNIIKEISENEEIMSLVDEYTDKVMEYLVEENSTLDTKSLEKDIIEYLKTNKKELNETYDINLTDESIDEIYNKYQELELSNTLDTELEKVKQTIPPEAKKALKIVRFILSVKFKLILISIILINLVLIALIEKSTYKWIKYLSSSLITSGLITLILSITGKFLIEKISLMKINLDLLTKLSLIVLVFGIIISIVYKLMTKYYIKEKQNEISAVS